MIQQSKKDARGKDQEKILTSLVRLIGIEGFWRCLLFSDLQIFFYMIILDLLVLILRQLNFNFPNLLHVLWLEFLHFVINLYMY